MKIKALFCSILLYLSFFSFGQEEAEQENKIKFKEIVIPDSLSYSKSYSARMLGLIQDPLTPSKAAFYSTIIPGLGQAYLGKAWKVPLIYAAMGLSLIHI